MSSRSARSLMRTLVITELGRRTLIMMRLGLEFGEDPPYPDYPPSVTRGRRRPPQDVERAAAGRRRSNSNRASVANAPGNSG